MAPSGPSGLGLPPNETQAPIVLLDSVDNQLADNDGV